MSLLRFIGYTDTWALATSLYKTQAKLPKPEAGVRRLRVRERREDATWLHPEISKGGGWGSLRNKIGEASRLVTANMPSLEIAAVDVEMLDPHAFIGWHKGDRDEITVHLGIVSNPGAILYAGGESWSVGQGQIVMCSPAIHVLRSAVNFGDQPRISLVLTLRPRDAQEEP